VVLAAYLPVMQCGFVWNDSDYVTRSDLQSGSGLGRIWFEVGATEQYYPALHSAFWLEHRLWGNAAAGYHGVNILLHAISACLFVVILRRLWGSAGPLGSPVELGGASGPAPPFDAALFGGLIFALHPVCVESVAWISEQKNTLSTVFYLLAALTYLRWREVQAQDAGRVGPGGRVRPLAPSILGVSSNERSGATAQPYPRSIFLYLLASLFFLLALLSKSVTATLPAALLVICWWQRGRLCWKQDVAPLAPWLAFGAAIGAFTGWVEHRFVGAQGADFTLHGIERVLLAGRIVWFYLGKLVWPADLIFIYPRWNMSAPEPGLYLYPIAALGLLAALWVLRRRSRAPLAAALFFVGSLFPALGFFDVYPFRYSFVADHFQYLASLGIIALAAGGWARWQGIALGRLAALLVLGLCGVLTWRQSRTYADADTLYRATLARNPDCWLAHNNLANDLLAAGQWDEATAHYREAQRVDPTRPEAAHNLGIALGRAGRPAEAIGAFERALRLRPDYAEAHYNLGVALAAVDRLPEAIEHYDAALRLSPNHAEVHDGLGMALARSGRASAAIEQFEQAIALQPGDAGAYNNLGTIHRLTGQNDAAVRDLEEALRLQPGFAAAHYNLSLAWRAEGQGGAADAEMAEALRLRSGAAAP
jgi:Flp pilus assembly protein TadD